MGGDFGRGIEPKIIGGIEKKNPAHRGRKAGGFEGETEEKNSSKI